MVKILMVDDFQAGYGAFLATASGMPHQTKALIVGFGGRKLLQVCFFSNCILIM